MCAGQVDDPLGFSHLNHQRAADNHRQLILADLVTFWQIRVEVVFARKYRAGRNLGSDGEAEADRTFDRRLVEYRQDSGQRNVDGVRLDVGRGAEGGGTARENLRSRRQLCVRFDADDHFPLFHHCLLTLQGQRPPARGAWVARTNGPRGGETSSGDTRDQSSNRPGRCRCQVVACW